MTDLTGGYPVFDGADLDLGLGDDLGANLHANAPSGFDSSAFAAPGAKGVDFGFFGSATTSFDELIGDDALETSWPGAGGFDPKAHDGFDIADSVRLRPWGDSSIADTRQVEPLSSSPFGSGAPGDSFSAGLGDFQSGRAEVESTIRGPRRDISSQQLNEMFKANSALIIRENPGAGVLAERYMNPTSEDGTPKGTAILDSSFLEVKPVEDAVATNKQRFVETTLQRNASRINGLDVGESVAISDHWDAKVNATLDSIPEYDITQSLGKSTLNSQGDITATVIGVNPDGSREVRIDYDIHNVLFDHYNWDSTLPLAGNVNLGGPGRAVGPDGQPIEEGMVAVTDVQMDEQQWYGAQYYPIAGVVEESGSLVGTVSKPGFPWTKAEFAPAPDTNRYDRRVVTDPDSVVPLLEKAIELNGGKPDSVPALTSEQRNNATVIGVDGYVDDR